MRDDKKLVVGDPPKEYDFQKFTDILNRIEVFCNTIMAAGPARLSAIDTTGLPTSATGLRDKAAYSHDGVMLIAPTTTIDADTLDGHPASYFGTASGAFSGSYNDLTDKPTATDLLTSIKTVDGTGSGLDADLLDGQEGSYYLASSSYTAADVLTKIKTVDGTGSGLDADLLDGQSGSYYTDITTRLGYTPVNQAGDLGITGSLRTTGEVQSTSSNGIRIAYSGGTYGTILRQDSNSFYLLLTASGDQFGNWNSLRPWTVNLSTGDVAIGTDLTVGGGLTVGGDITVSGGNITGTASGNPPNSRQVIAGNGLTGGGDLSADRTLAVGAGTGITVATSTVSVDSTVWRDANLPSAAQIGTLYGQDAFGSVGTVALITVNSGTNPGPGGNVAGSVCNFSSVGINKSGTPAGTWQLTGNISATGGSSGSTTTAKRVA